MIHEKDIVGEQVDIGDIVVYARQSILYSGYVLGLTSMGIYISENSRKWNDFDVSFHDKKKYYRYLSFKIIKKNTYIPEQLRPLCNFNQMKRKN